MDERSSFADVNQAKRHAELAPEARCPAKPGRSRSPGSPSVCAEEHSFKWTRARDCLRFYIFFKQLLDLTGLDQTSVFLSKRQTLPAAACAPR